MMLIDSRPASSSIADDAALVARARAGDQKAVVELLSPLHKPLYNLARRMVWSPEDAEDLVQDAMLRLLTRLGSYRGEARFSTWAYRVALNSFLNTRRRHMELASASFDRFGDDLERALAHAPPHVDAYENDALLVEEVKLGCMTGMLLCLDRPARLAYILGEIFEVESEIAASLCEISPAAFRQRLSRARRALNAFVKEKCGQASSAAVCSCERMAKPAVESGRVSPKALLFASAEQTLRGPDLKRLQAAVRDLDGALCAVQLYRAHPAYEPARGFEVWLEELVSGKPLATILTAKEVREL